MKCLSLGVICYLKKMSCLIIKRQPSTSFGDWPVSSNIVHTFIKSQPELTWPWQLQPTLTNQWYFFWKSKSPTFIFFHGVWPCWPHSHRSIEQTLFAGHSPKFTILHWFWPRNSKVGPPPRKHNTLPKICFQKIVCYWIDSCKTKKKWLSSMFKTCLQQHWKIIKWTQIVFLHIENLDNP